MNKISTFLILTCVVFLASGCLIINGGKKCSPSEIIGCDQDPIIEEINAVGKLSMSSDREKFYTQIAKRDPLCQSGQVALVKAAYRNLHMSNSKVDLMLTLIDNPSFCPAAKSAILNDLNKLHMESDKVKILDAMAKRGTLKPPVVIVEAPVEAVEAVITVETE